MDDWYLNVVVQKVVSVCLRNRFVLMNKFPRSRRLLSKEEYDKVFSKPQKIITPEFIILYCANTLGFSRLGLAISKKSIAKAHDRNRIKRLLRETFRVALLPAIDIVILAKKSVVEMQNATVILNLNKAWNKLSR